MLENALAMMCSTALRSTICWGFIESSKEAIVDSLTSFILSPDFYCEKVAIACESNEF